MAIPPNFQMPDVRMMSNDLLAATTLCFAAGRRTAKKAAALDLCTAELKRRKAVKAAAVRAERQQDVVDALIDLANS